MHDSGSTRDQKLIFINSGDNIEGTNTDFNLSFPAERFTAQEPAKMRLNLHQFQMNKCWPNINRSNRRFFMAIPTIDSDNPGPDPLPTGQPALRSRYDWQPIDLVASLIPDATTALTNPPTTALTSNAPRLGDLVTAGRTAIQDERFNRIGDGLNIKDIARCPRSKFPADGIITYGVTAGTSSLLQIEYNYEQPLGDTRDLRSVLEYSINMRLHQIAYGEPYDSRYDLGFAVGWLKRYNLQQPVSPERTDPCLAVQVDFDEDQQFTIWWCSGLPNARWPTAATNRLAAGKGANGTNVWNPRQDALLVNGNGTGGGQGAAAIYFMFPQFQNGSQDDYITGIANGTNGVPAYPNIPLNTGFGADSYSMFGDCGEVLGAWSCRANQPSTNTVDMFDQLVLPAPATTNEVGASGLIPICITRGASNDPNNPSFPDFTIGDAGLVGWKFPAPPNLETWRSVNIHCENVQNNNYESIGFTQGHDKTQQKLCVPSTLMAKIPLPTLEYQVSNESWFSGSTFPPAPAPTTDNPDVRHSAWSEMIGTNIYNKISWEATWSTIFGITLDNPTLNAIRFILKDDKGRPIDTLVNNTSNKKNVTQQNAGVEMTVCFHVIYNPPIPKPLANNEIAEQVLPTETLLGGANTNTIMNSEAQQAGMYHIDIN